MPDALILAVVGNPISHSLSPYIFHRLFRAFNLKAEYIRIHAESAEAVITAVKAIDIKGFNVTSPFKNDIMKHLDEWEEEARVIGAVNTVVADKKSFIGHNSDHIGVVETLKAYGIDPQHKKAVIIGAGGAARAAAYGLIQSRASRVILINRTEENAKKAARQLGCDYVSLPQAEKALQNSDILISCVPATQLLFNTKSLKRGLVVLDANYRNSPLPEIAKKQGCQVLDGKEWLLQQALPAFHLFTGKKTGKKLQEQIKAEMFTETGPVKNNLALIGFMGTGKSRIGRSLAAKKGMKFVDMDKVIEDTTGETIPEIFQKKGEESFRKIEKFMIRKHLPPANGTVFSLGGGAVLDKENRDVLKRCCRVVWLWASIPTIWQRIDISSRPLLNSRHPKTRAQNLLSGRIPLYARASDLLISTESGSPESIAERIKNEMD